MSTRDEPRAKKTARTGPKKMAARRAAKFREETPRKGGGFAIEDRNTALQQYAGKHPPVQARKIPNILSFSRERLGNFLPFLQG